MKEPQCAEGHWVTRARVQCTTSTRSYRISQDRSERLSPRDVRLANSNDATACCDHAACDLIDQAITRRTFLLLSKDDSSGIIDPARNDFVDVYQNRIHRAHGRCACSLSDVGRCPALVFTSFEELSPFSNLVAIKPIQDSRALSPSWGSVVT